MMDFPIANKELAGWCRRVGRSLDVGLNIVKVLKREGEHRSGSKIWRKVALAVVCGDSLSEALEEHRGRLGDLFLSMIKVGEETGHLGEILLELADYYDQLIDMRRAFLRSIMPVLFELGAALFIVGLVILIMGFLPVQTDLLGFGMTGIGGLIRYLLILALLFGTGWGLFWYFKTNVVHLHIVHHLIDLIPKIGPIFRTMSMFRLTKALSLTLGTGMDVRAALTYSFHAASYGPISDRLPIVLRAIDAGETLEGAFAACHIFDHNLMIHLESSEKAGMIPEVMQRLSRQYYEDCQFRLKTLSVLGYFAVFTLVAGIIIFFIFRLFLAYLQPIQDIMQSM